MLGISALAYAMMVVVAFDVRILRLLALTKMEILTAVFRVSVCIALAWTVVLPWVGNLYSTFHFDCALALFSSIAWLGFLALIMLMCPIRSDRAGDSRWLPAP